MSETERLSRLRVLRLRVEAEIADLEWKQQEARKPRSVVAACGTDGGYYRHIRTVGEPACDDCKAAHARAERVRSRRAREDAA